MKRLLLFISIVFCLIVQAQDIPIPSKPNPPRLVNDYADQLTPEQEDALERKLVAYDDSTSNQIAVIIVKSLGGYEPEVYATELGERWGVGGAKFDNGVVVLVSMGTDEESRKAFIAVGRGLEGAIPDMTAGHIYEDILVPYLRAGNFYGAFDKATDAIIRAAAGEYKAPEGYRSRGKGGFSLGKLIVGIIILFVILSIFGGGNRGGGYMSRRGYRGFGGPVIFPTGGFGGGGGGGGGFGGFGGGGFGGGGAGGNW
jgi:uncharacterized protein